MSEVNKVILVTDKNEVKKEYPADISLLEIAKYKGLEVKDIVGVKLNNSIVPLDKKINRDARVEFLDCTDINGYKMYQSGLAFILYVAVKELFGSKSDVTFLNSLDKGTLAKIVGVNDFSQEKVEQIKHKMQELARLDLVFEKNNVKKREAVAFYESNNEMEKALNVQNSSSSTVVIYKLKNYFNYFYNEMPRSTGCLTKFDLLYLKDDYFVLVYPDSRSNNSLPHYTHYEKTLEVFDKYRQWVTLINTPYVSDVNKLVACGDIENFININQLLFNEFLQEASKGIFEKYKKGNLKAVFLAGPSSSGKTTSAKRVAQYLRVYGIKSHVISVDDYFKEREDSPKLPNGDYDFESIACVDLNLFKKQVEQMLAKEEVIIPEFNFYTGKKEYKNKTVKLKDGEILIFEGLHCLNKDMYGLVPGDNYKIYVSPFLSLNIDRHNRISTVDLRLIRRIVRDLNSRGYSVEKTIKHWQKVRTGEEKYIYSFQNDADMILNTALIYELGVLKVFAEPLLYSVPVTSLYYEESRRLLGSLRNVFTISPTLVPNDSVLREFIGGSIFSNK